MAAEGGDDEGDGESVVAVAVAAVKNGVVALRQ